MAVSFSGVVPHDCEPVRFGGARAAVFGGASSHPHAASALQNKPGKAISTAQPTRAVPKAGRGCTACSLVFGGVTGSWMSFKTALASSHPSPFPLPFLTFLALHVLVLTESTHIASSSAEIAQDVMLEAVEALAKLTGFLRLPTAKRRGRLRAAVGGGLHSASGGVRADPVRGGAGGGVGGLLPSAGGDVGLLGADTSLATQEELDYNLFMRTFFYILRLSPPEGLAGWVKHVKILTAVVSGP